MYEIIKELRKISFTLHRNTKNGGLNMRTPIYPETLVQNSNESIVCNGFYDFKHFSKHEIKTIISVIRVSFSDKYPHHLRGIGFVNEVYPVIYKPRYILFELVIKLFNDSKNPYDLLAVAEAYRAKGAKYRPQAIEKYEQYFISANIFHKRIVQKNFNVFNNQFLFNNISVLYEKEHNFYQALKYAELAEKLNTKRLPHYPLHISKILVKIDPIQAVSYLTKIIKGQKYTTSKLALENELKEAKIKVSNNYHFVPRKRKETDTTIYADIENAAMMFLPGGKYYSLWGK